MREIKFRAWDTEKKTMLYESAFDESQDMDGWHSIKLRLCLDGFLVAYIDDDGGKSGLWEHEVGEPNKRFILEQFTGLRDRNGKEIYEGDIIRLHYPSDIVDAVVTWYEQHPTAHDGVFGMETAKWVLDDFLLKGIEATRSVYHLSCQETREVVGNIHENPELLAAPRSRNVDRWAKEVSGGVEILGIFFDLDGADHSSEIKELNAAIESHPRMKQLLEIEKAAEKMAEALTDPGILDGDEIREVLDAYASAKKEK